MLSGRWPELLCKGPVASTKQAVCGGHDLCELLGRYSLFGTHSLLEGFLDAGHFTYHCDGCWHLQDSCAAYWQSWHCNQSAIPFGEARSVGAWDCQTPFKNKPYACCSVLVVA